MASLAAGCQQCLRFLVSRELRVRAQTSTSLGALLQPIQALLSVPDGSVTLLDFLQDKIYAEQSVSGRLAEYPSKCRESHFH